MTTLDRLSIYSVLGFISLSILYLRSSTEISILPLLSFVATVIGLGVEAYKWSDTQSSHE